MNHQDFSICWHFLTEENSYQTKHWCQNDRAKKSQWESDQTCWIMKSEANDWMLFKLIIIKIYENNN